MHNMLGNWDVDNDPAVGDAGERASRMLFSSADQRDGSNSWGISVHRQAAEEGNGGHINLRGSAVDLGTISAADANERDPAGMHDNTIDMHNEMGNTVHRTAAVTHDSLVIEQAPYYYYPPTATSSAAPRASSGPGDPFLKDLLQSLSAQRTG